MRILVINLRFVTFNKESLFQLIVWLNNSAVFFCWLYFENPLTNSICYLVCLMLTIERSSSVAAKYSTFPNNKLKRYKELLLTREELDRDLLGNAWTKQSLSILEAETNFALTRNNFDAGVFHMSFLDEINENLEQKRKDFEVEIGFKAPSKKTFKFRSGKERVYYSGVALFYVLIQHYNTKVSKQRKHLTISFVLGVVWVSITVISKAMAGLPLIRRDNLVDTAVFYVNLLVNGFIFMMVAFPYVVSRIDVDRTIFTLQQMSHFISTQKKSNEVPKLFPTMNFLEEFSLNSWKTMRRLSIDYGRQFLNRHQIYLPSVFLTGTICFFSIFAIQTIYARAPSLFSPSFQLFEVQVALALACMIFFFITFDLLMCYASVNEFFETHTLKLYIVRQILSDLLKYSDYYFKDSVEQSNIEKQSLDINQVFDPTSSSQIHTALAKEIRNTLGDQLSHSLKPFLEQSIQSIESIIDEIAVDQKYQSVEIIGFVIDKSFTFNLLVVLFSVAITFYELFISS